MNAKDGGKPPKHRTLMSNTENPCCFEYDGQPCPYESLLDTSKVLKVEGQSTRALEYENGQLPHYVGANDKQYCIFHTPGSIKARMGFGDDSSNVSKQFRTLVSNAANGQGHLIGFIFPPYAAITLDLKKVRQDAEFFYIRHCEFESARISFNNTNLPIAITTPNISGRVVFGHFRNIFFENTHTDPVTAVLLQADKPSRLSMAECHFYGGISFDDVKECHALYVRTTKFSGPLLATNFSLPKYTTFYRVKFSDHAINEYHEPQFRHLREQFSKQQARDLEGQMYIYEQRCYRKNLRWYNPSLWFHWLYDGLSQYGFSYERLFVGIILIQIMCGLYYAIVLPKTLDISAVQFVFAQLFKPYELLSLKANVIPKDIIEQTHIVLLSTLQSTTTYTLFALFLLALRWRFKRG
jgi:hypothetical protein